MTGSVCCKLLSVKPNLWRNAMEDVLSYFEVDEGVDVVEGEFLDGDW